MSLSGQPAGRQVAVGVSTTQLKMESILTSRKRALCFSIIPSYSVNQFVNEFTILEDRPLETRLQNKSILLQHPL
jgi:hypothetical protein